MFKQEWCLMVYEWWCEACDKGFANTDGLGPYWCKDCGEEIKIRGMRHD